MPTAEILAANEPADEIVILKIVLTNNLGFEIKAMVIVDSRDLYHALLSKNYKIDISVRPGMSSMRFYFENVANVFSWTAGSLNHAAVGTTLYFPLTNLYWFCLATENRQIDFSGCKLRRRDKYFG